MGPVPRSRLDQRVGVGGVREAHDLSEASLEALAKCASLEEVEALMPNGKPKL